MKRLSFHYHLKITMDSPVCRHHFTLRCVPCSDTRQRILELRHFLSPGDWLSRGRDQWGNALLYGCCGGQQTRTYNAIARSLANRYATIYYVDLPTNHYVEYSSSNDYKELEVPEEGSDFFSETGKMYSGSFTRRILRPFRRSVIRRTWFPLRKTGGSSAWNTA